MLSALSLLQVPGGGAAFDELTTTNMARFNEENPDVEGIKYFSYGARCQPSFIDSFRPSWRVIYDLEGDNVSPNLIAGFFADLARSGRPRLCRFG